MNERTVGKLVFSGLAAYLVYIGITCPCDILFSCHLTQLYLVIVALIAVMIYFNGLKFTSY